MKVFRLRSRLYLESQSCQLRKLSDTQLALCLFVVCETFSSLMLVGHYEGHPAVVPKLCFCEM